MSSQYPQMPVKNDPDELAEKREDQRDRKEDNREDQRDRKEDKREDKRD